MLYDRAAIESVLSLCKKQQLKGHRIERCRKCDFSSSLTLPSPQPCTNGTSVWCRTKAITCQPKFKPDKPTPKQYPSAYWRGRAQREDEELGSSHRSCVTGHLTAAPNRSHPLLAAFDSIDMRSFYSEQQFPLVLVSHSSGPNVWTCVDGAIRIISCCYLYFSIREEIDPGLNFRR